MRSTSRLSIFVVSLPAIAALGWFVTARARGRPRRRRVGFPSIDAAAVLQHTTVLSSTEFEGRAPGTAGEEKTVGVPRGRSSGSSG